MGALAKDLLKKMYDIEGREEVKELLDKAEKKLKDHESDRKEQSKPDTDSPKLG